jgi:hypothetical protein
MTRNNNLQQNNVPAKAVDRNEGHFSSINKHTVPSRPGAPLAVTGNRP